MDTNNQVVPLWALGAVAVLAVAGGLWLVSLRTRNVTIVDVFWGPAFLLLALVVRLGGPPAEPRHLLQLALVAAWSLRLAVHLGRRSAGRPEDPRYAAMRAARGDRFALWSLFAVFGLQGALVAIVGAPLVVLQAQTTAPGLRASDLAGVALWLSGFVFETVGDRQLARFKADPANRGRVLATGLWRYTRHPNYFGDACQWWGLWLLALAAPGGAFTVIGPLVMTWLLVAVSGVAMLDRILAGRSAEHRDYIARTPAFVPWFPRERTAKPPRGGRR